MPAKYEVVVGSNSTPVYAGDNVFLATTMYRATIRESAFGSDKEIVGREVTFYIEGRLTEQYQPLQQKGRRL